MWLRVAMLANVLLALLVVWNCRFEWRKTRKCQEQIADLKGQMAVQKHRASILKIAEGQETNLHHLVASRCRLLHDSLYDNFDKLSERFSEKEEESRELKAQILRLDEMLQEERAQLEQAVSLIYTGVTRMLRWHVRLSAWHPAHLLSHFIPARVIGTAPYTAETPKSQSASSCE